MPSAAKRKSKVQKQDAPTAVAPAERSWASITPALSEWLLEAVSSMGFERPTPVQASTIPLFLGNKDVVVEAVTGSGKTLAFLIPLVERILRSQEVLKKNHVVAVVVSPTRELATQIYTVLCSLLEFYEPSAHYFRKLANKDQDDTEGAEAAPQPPPCDALVIKPLLLLGGNSSPAQDLKNFLEQSPNFLVGTPGRLNDLLVSSHVHCSTDSFEALVLDEADRLLDLGFKETLTKIISRLPKQRRTGLFSASISEAVVGSLVRTGLRNPVKVVVKVRDINEKSGAESTEKRTPASLEMCYVLATPSQRLLYIPEVLAQNSPQKAIIYFSNCAEVDYYAPLFSKILISAGKLPQGAFSIIALHGKQSPSVRTRNFAKFVNAVTPSLLLTTDLAARGLDVPSVDLVLQISAPTDPKVFLHRCGRAGRAGRRGLAVLFLSPGREQDYISFLSVRKTPVSPLAPTPMEPSSEAVSSLAMELRKLVATDRAHSDRAAKAFVSHVRAYTKHQTTSIFRVSDINWQDLVDAFALLKPPIMPEMKGKEVVINLPDGVTAEDLKYKDKMREKKRLEEMEKAKNAEATGVKRKRQKERVAWSEKIEKKEEREERRTKRRKKREAERWNKMGEEERRKEEEWKELVETVKEKGFFRNGEGEQGKNGVFEGLD